MSLGLVAPNAPDDVAGHETERYRENTGHELGHRQNAEPLDRTEQLRRAQRYVAQDLDDQPEGPPDDDHERRILELPLARISAGLGQIGHGLVRPPQTQDGDKKS